MYAPYQVWKFCPDNQESITWYIFHLKRKRAMKTMVGEKVKTINADWIFFDSEDEQWDVLDTQTYEITDEWELLSEKEVKELWKEQLYIDANFTLADIANRKSKVWVFNSAIDRGAKGKPVFSEYEAMQIVKVWRDENKEPENESVNKVDNVFWIFKLKKQIPFNVGGGDQKITDDWVVYNFSGDRWELLEDKFKDHVKKYKQIDYETLHIEWKRFFNKLESKPKYINIQDIEDDTS